MKTFSTEEAKELSVNDRLAQGRANRKFEKKFNKKLSPQDAERIDSTRLTEIERDARGKTGERARKDVIKSQGQDDLLDKINKNRQSPVKKGNKFYGKPTGVDVSTGKGKYVPPKEIGGRTRYLDPKTNKASEEGIKKYINRARQSRTGSNIPVDSKTTDSIAKIAKTEYTDKINQEYGGRRARRAYSNAPSLADVQQKVDLKDRLRQKYGKGEYRKGFKKTQGVNQSDVSKNAKKFTDTVNQSNKNRTSSFKDFSKEIGARKSQSTTKFDRVNRYLDPWDDGDMGNPSSSQTPTKAKNTTGTKTGTVTGTKPSTLKIDSTYTPPKTSTPSIKVDTPKPPKLDKVTQGNKIVDKGFKQPPLSKAAKSFQDFKSKLPKPVRTAGRITKNVGGRLIAPAFAAMDAKDSYKAYRNKGYGKTGSAVRGTVKAGSTWAGFSKGAALGAKIGMVGGPKGALVGGLIGGALGGATASKLSDTAINAYDKTFKPKKVATKYQDPKYVAGVVAQKKKDKKPTGLSLGVSDKQWKARFGEEYVQEQGGRLKDRAQVKALRTTVQPFMNQGKVTVSNNNATGTPQPVQNNNTPVQTQKPVPTQTTQARPLGPTQQAASNIDAMRSPASGSRKVQPGLIGKLLGNRGGSTPQAKPVVPQAQAQAKPVVPQAQAKPAVPSQQARPGRTVGAPQGTGRPGAMVRVGSAINAVRSALSNKGPIQGRQTGAQRRVAQSQVRANRPAPVTPTRPIRGQGNRPIAGNQNRQGGTTPVAKPVTQAPVAKPVAPQAPVAKPAPQLTGAQRAQQMAKQRIAQGRNTVTGELKSKPKVRKIASPMDMDY